MIFCQANLLKHSKASDSSAETEFTAVLLSMAPDFQTLSTNEDNLIFLCCQGWKACLLPQSGGWRSTPEEGYSCAPGRCWLGPAAAQSQWMLPGPAWQLARRDLPWDGGCCSAAAARTALMALLFLEVKQNIGNNKSRCGSV